MNRRFGFARVGRVAALAVTLVVCAPLAAGATWWPNGTEVGTWMDVQALRMLAPDGEGGAFVGWSRNLRTRVVRMTSEGDYATGWSADGINFDTSNDPLHVRIVPIAFVPDDSGGVFVITFDGNCGQSCTRDNGMIFIRRVRADGSIAPGWPRNGIAVTDTVAGGFVSDVLEAVPDGRGGVLMIWSDMTFERAAPHYATYAQAIGALGERRWARHWLRLGGALGVDHGQAIVSDHRGGALAFWADTAVAGGPLLVHGQRIRSDGSLAWPAGGKVLAGDTVSAVPLLTAIPAGERGALVAWSGLVRGRPTVVALRVDDDKRSSWRRAEPVGASGGGIGAIDLVPAQEEGATIAWLQDRTGSGEQKVFAQQLDREGRRRWGPNGVPVCVGPGTHGPLALAPTDEDGAYVAWGDRGPQGELYATRLTSRGRPANGWPENGELVCQWMGAPVGTIGVEALAIARVSRNDAVVAWTDERYAEPGNPTLLDLTFAMLLTPHGPAASPTSGASPSPSRIADAATPVLDDNVRASFALRSVAPNPAPLAGATVRFALPDAAPATLELFDVAGRRVWTRDVGALGAGEHAVMLRDGEASAPGLYLVLLRRGERVASTRIVIAGSGR